MAVISNDRRRLRLGRRHFLAQGAASVGDVAAALVGLHSSDPVTVYLSARARVADFERGDLEAALYEDRTLLRLLGMRKTMFVVPPDIAAIMTAGCTTAFTEPERKRLIGYLENSGLTNDGDAWLRHVELATLAALEEMGESTAKELREAVPELKLKIPFGEGKEWGGDFGVSTRVLFLLATAGHIVRTRPMGTWLSSQYRWELLDRWCPHGFAEVDQDAARRDLVTRWLGAFGPGSLTDIKWWTGWGVGVTKQALKASRAVEVEMESGPGFVLAEDLAAIPAAPDWVALLPALDPTVMGWKERRWYLGNHHGELFDRNGNAGATVWHNGLIVGGWAQAADGEVRVELLDPVSVEAGAMIDAEVQRLSDWLGDSRITPRFRTPLEKRLLS